MTVRDRSKVKLPNCPQCSALTDVDWIDVRCSANEDHDVTSLDASEWAVEHQTPTEIVEQRVRDLQAQGVLRDTP